LYHILFRDTKIFFSNKYKDIIYDFCDTLKLLKKKFPNRKAQGMLTLSKLADLLKMDSSNENFHEASYDVSILNKSSFNK